MKTRVHVNLSVCDLGQSVAFYRNLFGAAPTRIQPDYANWRLDNPALHLAIVQIPGAKIADTNARHFGIELFDDRELEGWRKRVEEAGLSVRTEQEVTCCYAVANKFWATDPDGNAWEFWVRHADVPAEALAKECGANSQENAKAKAAGPCCVPKTISAKQDRPAKSTCC